MKRQGDPPQANLETLQISEVALLERRPVPAVPREAGRAISTLRKFNVFLSYSSKDEKWATKLAKELDSRGLKVWFDKWFLRPGQNVPLIPLLLPRADPANVPLLLRQIQWEDMRGGLTKDRIDFLVEAINYWTKRNPFRGLPAGGKQDE